MRLYNIILLLTNILISTITLAQSPDTVFIRQDHNYDDILIYTTDTIVFESGMTKQMLYGTTILPGTSNQRVAMANGYCFQKVTKSNCQQDMTVFGGGIQDKINSIISTDSTLTIDINVYNNCCYEFLCDISIDITKTLNLIYYGHGTYCDCDCCFGLTFYIFKDRSFDFSYVKAVTINGDRKTIKQINK
jgi:hypothetical protein